MYVPIIKTKTAISMGSPFSPERVAIQCAPTPRPPATRVANILFKPLPSVAPDKKQTQKNSNK